VKKAVDEVGEMQEIHSASMNDGFDRIQERANEAAKGRTDAEAVLHSSMGRMEQRMETLAAAGSRPRPTSRGAKENVAPALAQPHRRRR
jgi:hypothetical protein